MDVRRNTRISNEEAWRSRDYAHRQRETIHGRRFQGILEDAGVRISVGERGYKGNILIERLFRSYKWECVYLRDKLSLKGLKEVTR